MLTNIANLSSSIICQASAYGYKKHLGVHAAWCYVGEITGHQHRHRAFYSWRGWSIVELGFPCLTCTPKTAFVKIVYKVIVWQLFLGKGKFLCNLENVKHRAEWSGYTFNYGNDDDVVHKRCCLTNPRPKGPKVWYKLNPAHQKNKLM